MARRWLLFAIVIPPLLFIAWRGGESLKRQPWFCVSCHLPSGTRLHDEKMKAMTATPPESLAGIHFHIKPVGVGCYDCHGGMDFVDMSRVFWLETKNTLKYIFMKFDEPKKAERAIPDPFCKPCHAELREKSTRGSYHHFASHENIRELSCVDCHTTHTRRTGDGGFLDRAMVIKKCGVCHKNPEASPSLAQSLGVKGAN